MSLERLLRSAVVLFALSYGGCLLPFGGGDGRGEGGEDGEGDWSGGPAGESSGVSCDGQACSAKLVSSLFNLPACCATSGCGVVLDSTVTSLLGDIPVGCYGLDQPGDVGCGCPEYTFSDVLTSETVALPGCCTASGRCGYVIDLTSADGPNLGCEEATFGMGEGVHCGSAVGESCS